MILTFVFVNRNTITVAVNLKKMWVNMNKVRGYVVVYRLKKRQVYCKYEDDIRWDGKGGTVFLTFVFVNRQNEQTVKIERV